MNTPVSRNRPGLDAETREAARLAARRAGKTLNEWIDEAVREKALAFGDANDPAMEEDDDPTETPPEVRLTAVLKRLQSHMAAAEARGKKPRQAPQASGRSATHRGSPHATGGASAASRMSDELASLQSWLETNIPEIESLGLFEDSRANARTPVPREVRELRREVEQMGHDLDTLAPRTSTIVVEKMLNELEGRIARRRHEGVSEAALGPAERAANELRAVVRDIDAGPALQALRADIDGLGNRLDALDSPVAPQNIALKELARETRQMRMQVAALAKQHTPLEKIETALEALVSHVEALADAGPRINGGLNMDMAEIEGDLRDLVAQEVAGGMASFNLSIENLARRLDGTVDRTFSRRLEQFGSRIDALGETLFDQERAQKTSGSRLVETVVSEIGQKIDRIDRRVDDLHGPETLKRIESALARPIYDDRFEELSRRLDQMQKYLGPGEADRFDPAAAGQEFAKQIESLAGRFERALDPENGSGALQAFRTQLAEILLKLERTQPAAGLIAEMNDRKMKLVAEISELRVVAMEATRTAPREAARIAIGEISSAPTRDIEATQTLNAVHHMLEKLMDRFGAYEDVMTLIREEARTDQDGKHYAAPEDVASVSDPNIAETLSSVMEPPPSRVGPRIAVDMDEDAFDIPGSRSSSSFIDAARRAARQAVNDTNAAQNRKARRSSARVPRAGHDAQDSEKPTSGNTIFGALLARKRTLLAALGVFVLIAGAYHLANADHGAPLVEETAANVGEDYSGSEPELARNAGNEGGASAANPTSTSSAALTKESLNPPAKFAAANKPAVSGRVIDPSPVGAIVPADQEKTRAKTDQPQNIVALANDGNAGAQFELASRYMDGRDIARDTALAAQWFEKAAQQGLAPAQFRLGSMYEKGIGVDKDYAAARKWYNAAATAGNARAMHNLAVLLIEGEETKPFYGAAAQWFRKASEYGVRDSQYNLAILYARGLGVEKSLIESYRWFDAAARQGDADSAKKRDEVAARLSPVELEKARALANAFQPKTPAAEANDVPAPGNTAAPVNETAPRTPAGKAKVSQAQPFS
jgi:localization factor PodJL